MTKDEALKQVIDLIQPVAALADGTSFEHSEVIQRCVDAVEIALEALAQPEQEPVARVIDNGTPEGATEWIPFTNRVEPLKTGDLLYTTPPQPEQEPLDFAYVMEAGDDRWKKLPIQERNFCPRCGKRTADLTTIHTCTPPIAADS